MKTAPSKIAVETWIILLIGLTDLITTIVFIQHHGAQEANPIFRQYWEMGLLAFILAKSVLLVGPLYVLEWARKRNPRFVSLALRGAICAYIGMYGIGFMKLNTPVKADQRDSPRLHPAALSLPHYEHNDSRRHVGNYWRSQIKKASKDATDTVSVY